MVSIKHIYDPNKNIRTGGWCAAGPGAGSAWSETVFAEKYYCGQCGTWLLLLLLLAAGPTPTQKGVKRLCDVM